MDKLRNKYEGVQRGNWQQGSQQLDEALEKLEELARRQQQEIERLERRAALDPNAPSGGGSQRALAEELEEMVRRLERLSREQTTPQLRNLTRQAQAAAEAMRRASESDGNGVADARAALDRLKNIQRLADNQPQQQLQRGIGNASRRAQRLAREHENIGADMETLPEEEASRRKSTSRLQSRKLRMAEEVRDLESDLRQLAKDAGKSKTETSRALRGTADQITRDELANKIEQSGCGAPQTKSLEMSSQTRLSNPPLPSAARRRKARNPWKRKSASPWGASARASAKPPSPSIKQGLRSAHKASRKCASWWRGSNPCSAGCCNDPAPTRRTRAPPGWTGAPPTANP
jgi:hypothetical protein